MGEVFEEAGFGSQARPRAGLEAGHGGQVDLLEGRCHHGQVSCCCSLIWRRAGQGSLDFTEQRALL